MQLRPREARRLLRRRLARASALFALFAPFTCIAPALAQEAGDAEAERLRREAEAELLGGAPAGATDEEALRRLAASEAEDTSPLYQQLLDAFGAMSNRLNSFNPRITVFGDFLGRLSASSAERVDDGRNLDDRVSLREVELDLRADIDPYAKGVLILAFEEEGGGEYEATVEEGYLTLETLPLGLRSQLGRFRQPFGRVNALHLHDLPQVDYPLLVQDLFGGEGFVENAAQVSWLAPFIPLELYATLLNGENEALLAGSDSDDPAWLGRAELFLSLSDTTFLSLGSSFLFGYADAPGPVDAGGPPHDEVQLWGADVLFKWQPNQFRSVVVQGELFGLKKEVAGEREHAFGGYAFVQVQPLQRWYFGLRYDWSNYDEGTEDSEQWAIGAWVSFYTTEFLRFRIGYEHRERASTHGVGEKDLDTVYFQLTFVFGSHPVEPFWFNR